MKVFLLWSKNIQGWYNYIQTQCKSDTLDAHTQVFLGYATLGRTLSCRPDRYSLLDYFSEGFPGMCLLDYQIKVYRFRGFMGWVEWGWCVQGLKFRGKLIWVVFLNLGVGRGFLI